jgi:hypothetical protein
MCDGVTADMNLQSLSAREVEQFDAYIGYQCEKGIGYLWSKLAALWPLFLYVLTLMWVVCAMYAAWVFLHSIISFMFFVDNGTRWGYLCNSFYTVTSEKLEYIRCCCQDLHYMPPSTPSSLMAGYMHDYGWWSKNTVRVNPRFCGYLILATAEFMVLDIFINILFSMVLMHLFFHLRRAIYETHFFAIQGLFFATPPPSYDRVGVDVIKA